MRPMTMYLAAALASAASPVLALAPQADIKVMEGLEAGYAFDFGRSSAAFAEADRLAPDHPAGPFFLASLTWLDYSLNVDVPGASEELGRRFERHLSESIRRAQRMAEAQPKNGEPLFFLGSAYGMRGRWKIVNRQWISAAGDGWRAYRTLEQALARDPELYDAYLGLGMYDYYSDTMPGILKLASRLIVRGDKERGLRFIRTAVSKGHFSVIEAQLFLAGIYNTYEKQPDRALDIMRDLRLERPDNLFFLYMEVLARQHAKDFAGAASLGELLCRRGREVPYVRPHISLFDLHLAEAYIGTGDYEKALAAARRCIGEAPEPRKWSVTFCRLREAQVLDLLGRRREALASYKAVKERPDFWDSREKADRGLKRPARAEELEPELTH